MMEKRNICVCMVVALCIASFESLVAPALQQEGREEEIIRQCEEEALSKSAAGMPKTSNG